MNILFIEEDENQEKSLKSKIKGIYFKIIGKIDKLNIINDSYKNVAINKMIIRIPKYKFEKINKNFMKNLLYLAKQNGIKNVVLSKELNKKENFIYALKSNNFKILDGSFLIKNSGIEILEYVIEQSETRLNEEEVSILVNNNSVTNSYIISNIAELAKRINIITNNISRFKKIEKDLYEQKGIILSISNNKKKGLAKSKYLINIDFSEELISKYKLYKKAVIINLENKIHSISKTFSGIIINDIQISFIQKDDEEEIFKKFDNKQVYESKILALEYNEIKNIKQMDKFKVVNTLGNNGIINNMEYKIIKS